MDLSTLLGMAATALTIAGSLAGWLLTVQRRAHELESRVQRLEDTSIKAPGFAEAIDKLRATIDARMDALEVDLEKLTRVVLVLADREGINHADYSEPNDRMLRRKL